MLYGAVRAACAWLAATWLWLLLGGARRCNERSAAALGLRRGSVALLVTAHPDDEAMFFAPVVASLVALGTIVHVLCLSTGNAAGLGKVRAQELPAACAVLGVPSSRVHLVDDPRLQDGRHHWPPELVAARVGAVMADTHAVVVVSFDAHGISGHTNHVATHVGVLAWGRKHGRLRDCWLLRSCHSPLKFSSLLYALLAAVQGALQPRGLAVFLASPAKAARALCQHTSQLVWYRLLFLAFAQCCCINKLSPAT